MTLAYKPSHPWYYVLGHQPLTPNQIRNSVKQSDYNGYLEDQILKASDTTEPARSTKLKSLLKEQRISLFEALSRYRKAARDYRLYLTENIQPEDLTCRPVHTSMNLAHNHILNHLACIKLIQKELSTQPDLFGFL